MSTKLVLGAALVLMSAAAPLSAADHWFPYCPHSSPHNHTYFLSGATTARSVTLGVSRGVGQVAVTDTNDVDCDGDFDPTNPSTETADFDGDDETGVGGAFFGFGPWAHETTCNFGLTQHGSTVTVSDLMWGSNVQFITLADDMDGPDPSTCETDGILSGPFDCISPVYTGMGSACGAGGDGGFWVLLLSDFTQSGLGLSFHNPPTTGIITA